MRLRFGFVTGFGAGYYLGSMAGRERYEQLNRYIRKVRGSDAYDQATDKARAVAEVGAEKAKEGAAKAKEKASDKIHHNGSGQTTSGTHTS